jgi:hypothetical protein
MFYQKKINIFFIFNLILSIRSSLAKNSNYGYNSCMNYSDEYDCNNNNCVWCNNSLHRCKETNVCYNYNLTDECHISLTDRWFCSFTIIIIILLILLNICLNHTITNVLRNIITTDIPKSIYLMILMVPSLILLNYNISFFFYYTFGNLGLLILVHFIGTFIN